MRSFVEGSWEPSHDPFLFAYFLGIAVKELKKAPAKEHPGVLFASEMAILPLNNPALEHPGCSFTRLFGSNN